MKKTSFVKAGFFALALNIGFTSCGSDSIDDEIVGAVVNLLDQVISGKPAGVTLAPAAGFENSGVWEVKGGEERPIDKVLLADKGRALVCIPMGSAKLTRADGSSCLEGTYKVNPDGTVDVTVAGFDIKISPSTNEIIINDTKFAAEAAKASSTDAVKTLCRTWYPAEYSVVAYVSEKAFGDYTAKNIPELQRKLTADFGTDVKLIKGNVENAAFFPDGTIAINYNGTGYELADWQWLDEAKGEISVSFSATDKDMMNLPGYVRFQKGTPNTCYLISNIEIEAKGKDKVPFKANLKLITPMKDTK